MTLRDIFRAIRNQPELVVYTPIRLEYAFEDSGPDDPVMRDMLRMSGRLPGDHEDVLLSLLRTVYGSASRDEAHPATIVSVREIHQRVGHYQGQATAAIHLRLEIELLRPADGALIAKRMFDTSPPERIGASTDIDVMRGKAPRSVSGSVPRRDIEEWLRSFPCRASDPADVPPEFADTQPK